MARRRRIDESSDLEYDEEKGVGAAEESVTPTGLINENPLDLTRAIGSQRPPIGGMRHPKAFPPAPLGRAMVAEPVAAPPPKAGKTIPGPLFMTAAVVSKPTQSLIAARTGLRIGPAQPVRVRIIR